MSTQRRTMGVHSRKRPFGPNGEKICYNCSGPLPKGCPYNCSPKCSEEWQCKTSPSRLRQVLRRRDKGVCALCHVDTVALHKEYDALPKVGWKDPVDQRAKFLELHGVPPSRGYGAWWDADHIVPVVEGGGECGPDGFQTLCIPCHKRETAELRKRMAIAAKQAILSDLKKPLLVDSISV